MKIVTSLCLGLALFSPVFAQRASRTRGFDKNRRIQESTLTPSPSGAATAATTPAPFYTSAPSPSAPTTAAPTPPPFNADQPPELNTGPSPTPVSPIPTTSPAPTGKGVVADNAQLEATATDEPSTSVFDLGVNEGLMSDEAKGGGGPSGKGKGSPGGGGSGSSSNISPDGLCKSFCATYMAVCDGANTFFKPSSPRGAPARRLIAGNTFTINRLKGSVFDSLSSCESSCMQYPRPTDPALYLNPTSIGINSIGDTFWCRNTHLNIAATVKSTNFGAQVHCPFAAPDGGGLCINVPIDSVYQKPNNASGYEFERAGAETSRHLGYCQMYYNDLVADCTSAGIDDRTLPLALALIPIGTEVLILNNNVGKRDPVTGTTIGQGITSLPDQVFRGLMCPECIKSLIIDDGNIQNLTAGSFSALVSLESLSLNMQKIAALPSGLLASLPNLREFSFYNTRNKPGLLTSVPGDLFSNKATKLRRIVLSGQRGLNTLPASLFTGLDASLRVLIMSNNGFTNTGINTAMFRNLFSMQVFDMSNNQFTTVPAAWFAGGWAISLRNLYLQENPISVVEKGIFDFAQCRLENVLLHDTDLIGIDVGLFNFCAATLISYTISPRL